MSSDRAFRAERSAVPPYRAAEQRNTGAPRDAEQRNGSGTVSLKALADKVLSRSRAERIGGTIAERAVPPPPERSPFSAQAERASNGCPHVTEDWLREWYAANPKLTCARCWLEKKKRAIQAVENPPTNSSSPPAGTPRNRGAAR